MNLGGLGLYRKLKMVFGSNYNTKKDFLKKGETYYLDHINTPNPMQFTELFNCLEKISFDSVLEFGCGYGLVTKKILDNFKVNDYVAFDLSPHQIYNAKLECKKYNVDFRISTIEEFTIDRKFDLVIGSGVFMHNRPETIQHLFDHLFSYSKKHFIHIDPGHSSPGWNGWKQTKLSQQFRHDYEKIYKKHSDIESIKITPILLHSKSKHYSVFHITKHSITSQNDINVMSN